jgi:outer membrane protein OmpA-like peptidoglycan-associated protein
LPFLSRVARVLERFPRREIRLEGHADVHEQGHRKIGFQRASWLADFMADQGMPISRLTVASRGAERPLRPEGSYWARAANRRVELVVE